MGFYYNKLVESAVDDVIQTPDDIGVDLDAIEKNIVGDDGCEAHREEIDDAMEGVVGDPLEEAATIMYESEYNFNQLMKCIGMAELSEMAAGRDFVLEAGSENSKTFWEKTKEMFKKMFENITRVFRDAISKITTAFAGDGEFVRKHRVEIENGFNNSVWMMDAYDIDALNYDYKPVESKLGAGVQAALANTSNWNKDNDTYLSNRTMIKNVSGIDAEDVAEMRSKLEESIFIKKQYKRGDGEKLLRTVCYIMNSKADTDLLRKKYDEIKASYKALFKELEELKAEASKERKDKDERVHNEGVRANTVVMAYIAAHKYEKNLQNTVFTMAMKAHKTRRNQARSMAVKWYNAGKKEQKGQKKPEVQHNSAMFSVNII